MISVAGRSSSLDFQKLKLCLNQKNSPSPEQSSDKSKLSMLCMDDDDDVSSNDEGDVQVVHSPKLYRSNGVLFKNGINVDSLL